MIILNYKSKWKKVSDSLLYEIENEEKSKLKLKLQLKIGSGRLVDKRGYLLGGSNFSNGAIYGILLLSSIIDLMW